MKIYPIIISTALIAASCLYMACKPTEPKTPQPDDDEQSGQEEPETPIMFKTDKSTLYEAWYDTHPYGEGTADISTSTEEVRLSFFGWGESKDFITKVNFPESNDSCFRAIMTYRMGGWNEGPGEWDMTTMIFVKNKLDGQWYEIARAFTPYGGSFGPDWEKKYYMDVTPYLPMLTGDTEFRIYYGGFDATDQRAHTVTLTFDFYKGRVDYTNVFHAKIYDSSPSSNTGYRSWAYGIDTLDIEAPERLGARTVTIPDNVDRLLLKVSISGHGHDQGTFTERPGYRTNNAAEFDENFYDIIINGEIKAGGHIFYSNADTYPQAGTYQYDRANWGPGLPLNVHYWEITNIPEDDRTMTIDLDLEDFVSAFDNPKAEGAAQYIVETDLFGFESVK